MLPLLVLAAVFLAPSLSASSEFPGAFPARSPGEESFRQARLLEGEKPSEAAARYRELLEQDFPAPDALHWALARLLPDAEAEPHWQAVLGAVPPSPFTGEALRALATLYRRQGRPEEEEAALRRVLGATGDRASRARAQAELLGFLDRTGKREEALRAAKVLWTELAASPESRTAAAYLEGPEAKGPLAALTDEEALARGLALLNGGSREEAAKTLQLLRARLSAESPLAGRVALALGKALWYLRRYEEALDPLQLARTFPEQEEEARFFRSRALFGANRGDEGARELVALVQERPQGASAARYLEQAYRVFEGRGLTAEASAAREMLLRKYGRSPEARQARWFAGFAAYREGRCAEAAECFRGAAEGAERGWLRTESLYWEARSRLAVGESERGRTILGGLLQEAPLGYYGRLARALLEGRSGALLADPRTAEARALPLLQPEVEGPAGEGADDGVARARAYLRLGLPEAARSVLKEVSGGDPRKAGLSYWAEDFHGAIQAARTSWLDWPGAPGAPAPLSREGLAYPLAYPRSAWEASRKAGIHPHLLLAVAHTESHFNPRTYSVAEARGLMQFIPSTGQAVARAAGLEAFTVEDLYEPRIALELGARHLRELLDRFSGDAILAVAAYNAGATAVAKWKEAAGSADPEVFIESIPFSETRRYVKKVLTALDAYGRLDSSGLWLR
ncbi:MAG: transglycosylase SLT domain-containing protein [Deltaproteobacteria bacterium]|nr:transglycosylase SLT domain-containing protein [Deltaproteobacteria bacterium]